MEAVAWAVLGVAGAIGLALLVTKDDRKARGATPPRKVQNEKDDDNGDTDFLTLDIATDGELDFNFTPDTDTDF